MSSSRLCKVKVYLSSHFCNETFFSIALITVVRQFFLVYELLAVTVHDVLLQCRMYSYFPSHPADLNFYAQLGEIGLALLSAKQHVLVIQVLNVALERQTDQVGTPLFHYHRLGGVMNFYRYLAISSIKILT